MDLKGNKVFQEYLSLYEEYIRIHDLFMETHQRFDKVPITNYKEMITVNFNQNQFTIKKPIYKCFSVEMGMFQNEMDTLMNTYDFEKKQILYNGKSDMKEIKELTNTINMLNTKIKTLEKKMQYEKALIESELTTITNENDIISKERVVLFEQMSTIVDDIQKKTTINKYSNLKDGYKSTKKLSDYLMIVDDYIITFPVLDTVQLAKSEKTEKKIKEKLKKVKKVSKKTETDIKDDMKANIKKSIFKTLGDCNSTKRSLPTYLNKTDILEIISKDPELKKKVGSMYKKMSRSELCDKLFI